MKTITASCDDLLEDSGREHDAKSAIVVDFTYRRKVADLLERDAIIAAAQAERADAALLKARLTTALLEIERIKLQLAVLRRQRYGQSSERLDHDIDQLEMQLEDLEAERPRLIVDDAPEQSNFTLDHYPLLSAFVRTYYDGGRTLDGFCVYVRKAG